MTKILFTSIILAFLFSSCVITEDIHFAKNGSVRYQLSIDMSQMAESMGANSLPAGLPLEPISITQLLKDSIGDTNQLSAEHKQILKNLTPFFLRPRIDAEGEEFAIEIYGDFNDVDQLNSGVKALDDSKQLEALFKSKQNLVDDEIEEQALAKLDGLSIVGKLSTFAWNGKKMQRSYIQTEDVLKEQADDIDDDSLAGRMMNKMLNPLVKMLEMGQYQSRYHFQNKVETVNIEYDELSNDGKTVIFKAEGLSFLAPTSNILISLKK